VICWSELSSENGPDISEDGDIELNTQLSPLDRLLELFPLSESGKDEDVNKPIPLFESVNELHPLLEPGGEKELHSEFPFSELLVSPYPLSDLFMSADDTSLEGRLAVIVNAWGWFT